MKKIIGLFLLFFVVSAWAQTPHAINYSLEEGLPSSNVYFVFQDSKNYIWFATDVGVVKYNGRDFIHYNTDDGLADNEVFQIHEDNKGRLWFLTLNGKLSYYLNGKFYNEKNTAYLKSKVLNGMLQTFFCDNKGQVHISDRYGNLYHLNAQNKVSEDNRFAWTPGVSQLNIILSFFQSETGAMRMLMNKGVTDANGKVLLSSGKVVPELVMTRTCRVGNVMYFNDKNNVYRIDEHRMTWLFALPQTSAMVISLDCDAHGNLWLGTRKGVYYASVKNSRWHVQHFFPSLSITKVLLDNNSNYWLTSLESGALMIPDMQVFSKDGFANTRVSVIDTDLNSDLWAGGYEGNYYHFKGNGVQSYHVGLDAKNVIKDFLFTPDAFYVVGNQATLVHSKNFKSEIKLGGNCMFDDNQDNIWFGSVIVLKCPKKILHSNNWYNLVSKNYSQFLKLTKRINAIAKGEKDELWLGTNFGLYKYLLVGGKDSIVNYNQIDRLNANIEDLYFDKKHRTLLIASNSQGVIILKDDKIISHFTRRNKLSNNNAHVVAKAGANSYWIGTNTGLDKIYLAGKQYRLRNYNPILALNDRKINDIEVINDTVYLATDNGILYFNQYKDFEDKAQPYIHLTEFRINGQPKPWGKKLTLQHDQNELTIAFDGISYLNTGKLQYHYKLEGSDENWFTTSNSQINYKALAPGQYIFKVYVTDARNNKSKTSTIKFSINQPFWKTLPFVVLFLLVSIAILLLIWRMRLRKLERQFSLERKAIQAERDKATLEKQMIELEQKALRLQMNPHFIFNALNTIKGYYAEGNDVKASDYISKFSKLLRMLLENTEQLIPLSKEVEMLQLYIALTQIRYKNKFDYILSVDPKLNPDDTAIPALLLQPMVENAIIHGLAPKKEKGLLQIRFEKKDNQLICLVTDNGIGRSASQKTHKEYISKATEITTERIELLANENAQSALAITDLKDENQNPAGTQVFIAIPLTTIW